PLFQHAGTFFERFDQRGTGFGFSFVAPVKLDVERYRCSVADLLQQLEIAALAHIPLPKWDPTPRASGVFYIGCFKMGLELLEMRLPFIAMDDEGVANVEGDADVRRVEIADNLAQF